MSRRGYARASLLAGAALVLSSCAIDTELGLDASITAASVTVSGADVSASLDVTYRVGPHAEGERQFAPQAVELFVGETLVAQLTPSAPGDFNPRIAPGESRTVTLSAAGTDIVSPEQLCDPREGGVAVTVLFRWQDQSNREFGSTDRSTTQVSC